MWNFGSDIKGGTYTDNNLLRLLRLLLYLLSFMLSNLFPEIIILIISIRKLMRIAFQRDALLLLKKLLVFTNAELTSVE
jgi:hypothetical protein